MTKEIKMAGSKYTIEYDPAKQWDYRIKRCGEDISDKLKRTNVMNDLILQKTSKKVLSLKVLLLSKNKI